MSSLHPILLASKMSEYFLDLPLAMASSNSFITFLVWGILEADFLLVYFHVFALSLAED